MSVVTSRGRFSDYYVERILSMLRNSWISLHFDNPVIAGTYTTEVVGGGYARQRAVFSDPSPRSIFNIGTISFTRMPAVRVSYFGLWDTAYNGNMLLSGELSSKTGDEVIIPQGQRYEIGDRTIAIAIR